MFAQNSWCITTLARRIAVVIVTGIFLTFTPRLLASEEYTHSVTRSLPSGSAMSAQALVDEALRANPGIAALEAAIRGAEARIVQSTALPDPQLFTAVAPDTIGGYNSPNGRGSNVRMELTQTLPWPGKLRLRGDAATKTAEAERGNLELRRLQLRTVALSYYAQWNYIHQAITINERNSNLVDELRRVAEARYAAGITNQPDVLLAEVELQHIRHRSVQLQRQMATLRAQINTLLNRSTTADIALSNALPPPTAIPDFDTLRLVALSQHPGLAAAKQQIAASRDKEQLADKDFYPDFKLFTGYNSLWDETAKRWVVGIGINLPLGRDKYRAARDESRANTVGWQSELDELRSKVLGDVEEARVLINEALHTIALYEHDLLPRTAENLSATRAAYGAGGGRFSELISAEQVHLDAELSLQRARADYQIAKAALENALGGPLALPKSSQQNSNMAASQNSAVAKIETNTTSEHAQ
jgi:cobalt-zinc-cadmium efflux system outer membrane protein